MHHMKIKYEYEQNINAEIWNNLTSPSSYLNVEKMCIRKLSEFTFSLISYKVAASGLERNTKPGKDVTTSTKAVVTSLPLV